MYMYMYMCMYMYMYVYIYIYMYVYIYIYIYVFCCEPGPTILTSFGLTNVRVPQGSESPKALSAANVCFVRVLNLVVVLVVCFMFVSSLVSFLLSSAANRGHHYHSTNID